MILSLSNNVDNRVPMGPFGFGFLSWQGNNVSFEESKWLTWILIGFAFLMLIIFTLFKKNIKNYYQKHQSGILIFFQIYSLFIIFLAIFYIVIRIIGKYPNTWELIPLHFCRLFVLMCCSILLFKKVKWIKYISFYTLCGAIVGLLISDLSSSSYWDAKGGIKIGYDSYPYWDYFIIHISGVLIAWYIILANQFKITKFGVMFSSISLISFFFIIFILNWSLSFCSNEAWQANWFYVAPDHINGIDDLLSKFLGPIAKWPFIWFLFVIIGIGLYASVLFIYFWIDHYEIDFKSKPIFKKVKPNLYLYYKNTRLF